MTAENDVFARIAVAEGFCTQADVDRCLAIQSRTDERLSLGQSLLREGLITQDQHSRVLVLLRKGYKKERDTAAVQKVEQDRSEGRAVARRGQEDRVLGAIVVAERRITPHQLKMCEEEATKRGATLADALVLLGFLDRAGVAAVLARLERLDLSCPTCTATLSVLRLPTPDPVRCPRCRTVLAPGGR